MWRSAEKTAPRQAPQHYKQPRRTPTTSSGGRMARTAPAALFDPRPAARPAPPSDWSDDEGIIDEGIQGASSGDGPSAAGAAADAWSGYNPDSFDPDSRQRHAGSGAAPLERPPTGAALLPPNYARSGGTSTEARLMREAAVAEAKATLKRQFLSELEAAYGPRYADSDVRLYLKQREFNASLRRDTRRGGFPVDDSLPKEGTWAKFGKEFREVISEWFGWLWVGCGSGA